MTPTADWLAAATAGAPATLHARVMEHVVAGDESGGSVADVLAASSFRALHAALRQPADRTAALDLLSADALITLALLAQSESEPAGLETFADGLLRRPADRA